MGEFVGVIHVVSILSYVFLFERYLFYFTPILWFLPLGSSIVQGLMYAQIWLLLVVVKDLSYLVDVIP